jgi:hypothetical protein
MIVDVLVNATGQNRGMYSGMLQNSYMETMNVGTPFHV